MIAINNKTKSGSANGFLIFPLVGAIFPPGVTAGVSGNKGVLSGGFETPAGTIEKLIVF